MYPMLSFPRSMAVWSRWLPFLLQIRLRLRSCRRKRGPIDWRSLKRSSSFSYRRQKKRLKSALNLLWRRWGSSYNKSTTLKHRSLSTMRWMLSRHRCRPSLRKLWLLRYKRQCHLCKRVSSLSLTSTLTCPRTPVLITGHMRWLWRVSTSFLLRCLRGRTAKASAMR